MQTKLDNRTCQQCMYYFPTANGKQRYRRSNVCRTNICFYFEETIDSDTEDEIEESVVITIDDSDEYVARFDEVQRFDFFQDNFEEY